MERNGVHEGGGRGRSRESWSRCSKPKKARATVVLPAGSAPHQDGQEGQGSAECRGIGKDETGVSATDTHRCEVVEVVDGRDGKQKHEAIPTETPLCATTSARNRVAILRCLTALAWRLTIGLDCLVSTEMVS